MRKRMRGASTAAEPRRMRSPHLEKELSREGAIRREWANICHNTCTGENQATAVRERVVNDGKQ